MTKVSGTQVNKEIQGGNFQAEGRASTHLTSCCSSAPQSPGRHAGPAREANTLSLRARFGDLAQLRTCRPCVLTKLLQARCEVRVMTAPDRTPGPS